MGLKFGSVLPLFAITICAKAQIASTPEFQQLAALYARLDSATAGGRFDEVLGMALPDAVIQVGSSKMMFSGMIGQARKILQAATNATQTTTVVSIQLAGSEALVSRRTESTVTLGGQTRTGVDDAEDTWVRTPDGWRLKMSRVIGSREASPPTPDNIAQAVASQLRLQASAIGTGERDSLEDLEPIGKAIGGARVVGLGEATHGTLEVQTAKRRMIQYLVTKKGFTVLAVEATWPESLGVDKYVKTGEGDPAAGLKKLRMWPLQTMEMLRLIGFMRTYNQQTASPKASFSSFDMQDAGTAMEQVLSYLRRTSTTQFRVAEASYSDVRGLGPRHDGTDPGAQAAANEAAAVVQFFDRNKDLLVKASSELEWRDARQCARIVLQATSLRIQSQAPGYRDQMMANNVEWLIDEVHRGEKVILWAHNFHVGADMSQAAKPMGAWLRSKLGTAYYAVGFAVAEGEVRAVGTRGLGVYPMPAAPQDTGDGVFGLSGIPSFFLDLRSLAKGSELAAWMAEPHSFYSVGARWNQSSPESNKSVFSMSSSFDGLWFIRNGHGAVGIE